jgi:hypothetical protein
MRTALQKKTVFSRFIYGMHTVFTDSGLGNFAFRLTEPFWFQNVQLIFSSEVSLSLFSIKCVTALYLKKKTYTEGKV